MSKGRTRHVNPAESAFLRGKKPDPPLAKARPRLRSTEIQELSILPDIATWIKDGLPDAEVARRIQSQGFMVDKSFDAVRLAVGYYRQNVLAPVDVVPERLTRGQVKAYRRLEQGMKELEVLRRSHNELSFYIREMRRIYQALGGTKDALPDEGVEPEVLDKDGQPHLGAVGEPMPATDPKPRPATEEPFVAPAKVLEVQGMPEAMVRQYMFLSSEAHKINCQNISRLGALAVQSAQVKAMLGLKPLEEQEKEQDDAERRLEGYLERKFPGRADVKEVLLDPQKRARVMTLFQKMMADTQLHRDLEARYAQREAEQKAAAEAYEAALREAEAKRRAGYGDEDPEPGN